MNYSRYRALLALLVLVLASSAGAVEYARAGYVARMPNKGVHKAEGVATIIDERTVRVDNIGYDGMAPVVFFRLGVDDTYASFKNGVSIGPELESRAYVNESMTVQLPVGQTLDGFTAFGFWCVTFEVVFTSALFEPPPQPPAAVDDAYSTLAGTVMTIPAKGVLKNDIDPQAAALSAELVATTTLGTLTFNPDGSFVYMSTAAPEGGTDSFTYMARNSFGLASNVATATITIFPQPAGGGGGGGDSNDLDGDGFSNALEMAAGTSPTDAASTPFNGLPAGAPSALLIFKLGIKLNFAKAASDGYALSGQLPLPLSGTLAGQRVIIEIAGVARAYDLDEKGRAAVGNEKFSLKPKGKDGVSKFSLKVTKADVGDIFAVAGLANADTQDAPLTLPVTVAFNQMLHTANFSATYNARKDRAGSAK